MIDLEHVLLIHEILIEKFGGSKGVRDNNGLLSALKRPSSTFGQVDLYPTPQDKAAAILESIVTNHPFIDGNKRTGYALMRIILLQNDLDIFATENEKYDFVINVSKGLMDIDSIKEWIANRTKRK